MSHLLSLLNRTLIQDDNLKVQCIPMYKQKGSVDCGVFSIAYAAEVLNGGDPAQVQYRQDKMRIHLLECMKDGHITIFPKAKQNIEPYADTWENNIAISCPCRRPDALSDMVMCESCSKWLHWTCEKIRTKKQVKGHWVCSQCGDGGACQIFLCPYFVLFVLFAC